MRESFIEYKKTIEKNIIPIEYIYSGDVISSMPPSYYSEVKPGPQTSPISIIKCIEKIYSESFDLIKGKAKEVVIPNVDIYNKINSILNTKYIFTSKLSYDFIGYNYLSSPNTSAIPYYFFPMAVNTAFNTKVFISPCVEEELDTYTLYGVDDSFQSMVYVLQNMEYTTNKIDDNNWEHRIDYQLYDCKFSATKLVIKNLSKMRDDRINEILS